MLVHGIRMTGNKKQSNTLVSLYKSSCKTMMEVNDDGLSSSSRGVAELTIHELPSQDQDVESQFRYVPNFYSEGGRVERRDRATKGILKSHRKYSPNERAVGNSLDLLCSHLSRTVLRESTQEVFSGLCLDEFFLKGECINSKCVSSHQYRTFVFTGDKVWDAALYVINHATSPNVRIIKNLVHFFSERRDMAKTLALSKCIAKVKPAEMLDLANFILNRLTGTIARRDTVTQILFLNFSDLTTSRFNQLIEGLGVFDQNTAHYSDLVSFLAHHGHKLPINCLTKLMNDALTFCSSESTLPLSISSLLKNISTIELVALEPTISEFLEKFGSLNNNCDAAIKDSTKESESTPKKHVRFDVDPKPLVVEELELVDQPAEPTADELPQARLALSSVFERRHASLVAIFGNTCYAWLVRSDCLKLVCSQQHNFNSESLSNSILEDVFIASDFVVDQTIRPPMAVMKAFSKYLLEAKEYSRVTGYRKCIPRLNYHDRLKLTELILSRMCRHMDPWEALELLMIQNLLKDEEDDEQFPFSGALLKSIMIKAVEQKHVLSRCFTDEIVKRYLQLSAFEQTSLLEALSSFVNKFLITDRQTIPNVLPKPTNKPSFSSMFAFALSRGGPTKFFVSCAMLKFALDCNLHDIAFDDLYKFLLPQFARARILGDMLDSLLLLTNLDRKSIKDVLGNVAVALCVHLFENDHHEGVAEIFRVLKSHRMNILTFVTKAQISPFNLAVMYCSVTIDCYHDDKIVVTFLEHCLQSFLDTAVSLANVPSALIRLTDKMFSVLTKNNSSDMLLELFNGILYKQKSLVCPLDITYYFEPTLRCSLLYPCDRKIRVAALKLYLEVNNFDVTIPLQNVTMRSIFVLAVMEVSSQHGIGRLNWSPNFFRPLVNKLLVKCVQDGAYPKLNGDVITLFSSMTAKEIQIYLLWWFNLFVRAKKRRSVDYYFRTPVTIVTDHIHDESRLPVHFSLKKVDPSESACVARLLSVVKSLVDEPLSPSMIKCVKRGLYEFCPNLMRNISHAVIRIMVQHRQIEASSSQLCSFCLDEKSDIELAPIT